MEAIKRIFILLGSLDRRIIFIIVGLSVLIPLIKPEWVDLPIRPRPESQIVFNEIDKSPVNLIKFNCANEFAVNLFAEKKINFGDIHNIIANSLSLDLKSQVNNVKNIIDFQNNFIEILKSKFL